MTGEWMHELGKEDMELLVQLGTLSLPNILTEVGYIVTISAGYTLST